MMLKYWAKFSMDRNQYTSEVRGTTSLCTIWGSDSYIYILSICMQHYRKKKDRKEKIKELLKVNEVDSQKKKRVLDVEYLIH